MSRIILNSLQASAYAILEEADVDKTHHIIVMPLGSGKTTICNYYNGIGGVEPLVNPLTVGVNYKYGLFIFDDYAPPPPLGVGTYYDYYYEHSVGKYCSGMVIITTFELPYFKSKDKFKIHELRA